MSVKISWIKRYATDRLDDHWADIIDRKLKISRGRRRQILTWGTEALTCMINKNFPCIELNPSSKCGQTSKQAFTSDKPRPTITSYTAQSSLTHGFFGTKQLKILEHTAKQNQKKNTLNLNNLDYQMMTVDIRKSSTCLMKMGSNQSKQ